MPHSLKPGALEQPERGWERRQSSLKGDSSIERWDKLVR
jgi:hypothetical protein